VIDYLLAVQTEMRRVLETGDSPELRIRWVRSAQFHLTLLFLGSVPATEVLEFKVLAEQAISSFDRLPSLVLQGTGCFPAFHRPRVLWVGCRPNQELEKLQAHFFETFSPRVGLTKNDGSYPHVTIARCRHLPRKYAERIQRLSKENPFDECAWLVNSVSLMQSLTGPSGPEYACLSNFFPPTRPGSPEARPE